MFNCRVCKRRFDRLTSLENHKKIHENYYQAENGTDTSTDDTSTDEKVEYVTDTSTDEKVEYVTDTSLDEKVEYVTYTSLDEKVEYVTDTSADTSADEKSVTDTSMDENVNVYSFDELEIISEEDSKQIFGNQDFVDETSMIFDVQDIVENQDILDRNIACETGQISEEYIVENIQEAINEFWSDDSYCSDANEANSAVFPHAAYRDFDQI
ncbi:22929_t:CDS:1, partial [Racocetra persica]